MRAIAVNPEEPMAEGITGRLPLRTIALALAGAGALFWLYTFYGIARYRSATGPASSGSR
jgi:hypothetical protein